MNFNIRKIYHNEINKINNLIDKNTRIAFLELEHMVNYAYHICKKIITMLYAL